MSGGRVQGRQTKQGNQAKLGRRRKLGETWWANRWTSVLESFGWASRLQRGRSYARSGHVLFYDVTAGAITARVQGSRVRPYSVSIRLKPLDDRSWHRVAGVMARQAAFAAMLLAGEMPRDIETAFVEAGTSLFPQSRGDLESRCSCPDWANPCKHVAAVAYVVAEAFDRDPFLLFQLRGRTREQLLEELQALRPQSEEGQGANGGKGLSRRRAEAALPPLLRDGAGADGSRGDGSGGDGSGEGLDLLAFWGRGPAAVERSFRLAEPEAAGLVLKRLGPLPAVARGEELMPYLRQVYEAATQCALALAAGEENPAATETGVR